MQSGETLFNSNSLMTMDNELRIIYFKLTRFLFIIVVNDFKLALLYLMI
jgi:hypothetical protein